jgi:hypothetical protein
MRSSGLAQILRHRVLGIVALTSILSCSVACGSPAVTTPLGEPQWRAQMLQVPLPATGCFTATYPSLRWQTVPCLTAPTTPLLPATGQTLPETVGGSATADYAGEVTNLITSATGSFPSESGVTSETDSFTHNANDYTLQLNTNSFSTTPVCKGHGSTCQGWQQFIFSSTGSCRTTSGTPIPCLLIQYWLQGYGKGCPSKWGRLGQDCVQTSRPVQVPPQPITNLAALTMTATTSAGGMDTVYLGAPGSVFASKQDNVLSLASAWTDAEFNVFGHGGGSEAKFNSGSALTVLTTVHHGSTAAPICKQESYSGESNNLTLVGAPTLSTAPAPAIEFTESNVPGGTPASCAVATGIGDTHLTTFNGLYYDFQATGDFLLAHTPQFQVQSRQVSGAPPWPDAAVNQAVATQMGATQVAVCATAKRSLVLNGSPTDLLDGHTLLLPTGVDVSRTGNVYRITDASGNSLRAVVNTGPTLTWIDVTVGLGTWPTAVEGLLANPSTPDDPTGNVHALAARDGTIYPTPVAFSDLYGHYGNSWRVAPADSLLAVCGGGPPAVGTPTQFFYAHDLPQNDDAQARAICTSAGVTVSALLDACTLDVAVLGTKQAAAVYVGAPAPAAVGEAGQT